MAFGAARIFAAAAQNRVLRRQWFAMGGNR